MAEFAVVQQVQRKLNRAYFHVFTGTATPQEADQVLADMRRRAIPTNLMKRSKNGSTDIHATIHRVGQADFFNVIEEAINNGRMAQ